MVPLDAPARPPVDKSAHRPLSRHNPSRVLRADAEPCPGGIRTLADEVAGGGIRFHALCTPARGFSFPA